MGNIRRINFRNQITLPVKILRSVGLKYGDYIEVKARGSELVLKKKKVGGTLSYDDWESAEKLVRSQVKAREYTEYSSVSRARAHIKKTKK